MEASDRNLVRPRGPPRGAREQIPVFGTRGGSVSFGCFRAGLSGAKTVFSNHFATQRCLHHWAVLGAGLSDNDTSNMLIEVK